MSLATYYAEKETYSKVGGGRLRGIIQLLGDTQHKVVLDIGCGAGEVGRRLKSNDSTTIVYGIDVSPNAVSTAQGVLDGACVYDIESDDPWPALLQNKKFDVMILSEVLEHLFEPTHFLQKIREKSDAPIIITVPNILFWKSRLRIFFGHFEYTQTGMMDRGHIHFFSWKSFRQTIDDAGYRIDRIAHNIPTRGSKLLGAFLPGLFAYQFVVRIIPKETSVTKNPYNKPQNKLFV